MATWTWIQTVKRLESEACEILKEYGYPVTSDELMKFDSNDDWKVLSASLIVHGAFYLRKYVDENKIDHALDRLVDICKAYEDLDTLVHVPAYDNKVVLTSDYYKHLRHGAKMAKKRKVRSSKVTEEEIKIEIDEAYNKNPRHGIGGLRSLAGAKLGISERQIIRISKYNPLKNS